MSFLYKVGFWVGYFVTWVTTFSVAALTVIPLVVLAWKGVWDFWYYSVWKISDTRLDFWFWFWGIYQITAIYGCIRGGFFASKALARRISAED